MQDTNRHCGWLAFLMLVLTAALPGEASAEDTTVRPTSLTPVNLDVQWRTWRTGVQEPGAAPIDVLEQVQRTATSLGHRNLPAHSLSLTHRALSSGSGGPEAADAQRMLGMAARLSPGLAEPHLAAAWHTVETNPGNLPRILGQYQAGIRAGLGWPETLTSWGVDLAIIGLLATLAAALVFTLGQVLRHFGVVAHDLRRLLPSVVSRNQCAALLLAATGALWLSFGTWVVPTVALLAACSLPQRPLERTVTLVFAALLAVVPTLDTYLSGPATFAGSSADRLHAAHYEGCDASCRTWLQSGAPDTQLTDLTESLVTLRQGTRADWKTAAAELKPQAFDGTLRPWAQLLKGALEVALDRPERALTHLESARESLPDTAAPIFNTGRAHQLLGATTAAERAFETSLDIDLERTRRKSELSRFDPASRLMLPRLPASVFLTAHRRNVPDAATVIEPAWRAYAWADRPLSAATPLGVALLVVTLLGGLFRWLGWTSGVCPRCGMAREPTDVEGSGGGVECLPCLDTTTGGPNRSYSDRLRQDAALDRRETARRWLPRLLVLVAPGSARVYMGWPIKGVALTWFVGLSACLMTMPTFVGRPINSLIWSDWLGLTPLATVLAAGLLLIVLLTAWYGVAAWRPSLKDRRSGRGR